MKRIRVLPLLALCLMLSASFLVTAAGNEQVLKLRRVSVYMPELTAEIAGKQITEPDGIKAELGGTLLTADRMLSAQECSAHIYLLFDISGSMKTDFEAMKTCACKVIDSFKDGDAVTIETFGETVQTLVSVSSDKELLKQTVNGLQPSDAYTLLYEGLQTVYAKSTAAVSAYDREYIVILSDGSDDQRGNTTFEEVKASFANHALPIYAVCTSGASQEGADALGMLARGSGGEMVMLDPAGPQQSWQTLARSIADVQVVKFLAPTNVAMGTQELLKVSADGQQAEQTVNAAKSIADTVSPTIAEISYDADGPSLKIVFSENVLNAQDTAAYEVKDVHGKICVVDQADYQSDTYTARVHLKTQPDTGEAVVTVTGVTDSSQEKNPLSDNKAGFSVPETEKAETNPSAEADAVQESGNSVLFIIFAVVVVILVLLIAVLVVVSHKKKEEQKPLDVQGEAAAEDYAVRQREVLHEAAQDVQYHIARPEGKQITLYIELPGAAARRVNMEVISSMIIGRSDMCDVYIDDPKMTRQHLCIEVKNGRFVVSDLQTTNGTKLNRIPLQSAQILANGDLLTAGNTKIKVFF